jgi:hypothetical protein
MLHGIFLRKCMSVITRKGNTPHELLLISVVVGVFIYYRRLDYYATIPRAYLSLQVSFWFVIAGLVALNVFGQKRKM